MSKKERTTLPREESTKRRRELIVNTAIECFAEKGFHQTSVRDIASKAEISLGSLYTHFQNKDALIDKIAEIESRELTVFEKLLSTYEEPEHGLDCFIEAYLNEVSTPLYFMLSIEITAEMMRRPGIGKRFDSNRMKMLGALEQVIKKGMARKVFDPRLDPEEIAELIIDVIEGTGSRAALTGKKISKKTIRILKWNIKKLLLI
ncbi:MAG: TetR family transcriptional regulator [Gammaproteobacteria bacterium]|nr:TetR family transcriptional regulator [Gammaproteobacteria bacterium]